MAYQLTTAYIILFDLVLVGFTVEVLRRAGASGKLRWGMAIGSAFWIGLLAALLQTESLYPRTVSPLAFFISILVGVGVFTAIGLLTPIGRTLAKAPQELLMLPQGLRAFFGAGFLIEGVLGIMPPGFAIADGITHITAAFLCMKAAVLIHRSFCEHYGTVVLPTKPRTPRHKGKVERGVDYVQENRMSHLEFLELILQDELLVRDERKIGRRVKAASFRDQ